MFVVYLTHALMLFCSDMSRFEAFITLISLTLCSHVRPTNNIIHEVCCTPDATHASPIGKSDIVFRLKIAYQFCR